MCWQRRCGGCQISQSLSGKRARLCSNTGECSARGLTPFPNQNDLAMQGNKIMALTSSGLRSAMERGLRELVIDRVHGFEA